MMVYFSESLDELEQMALGLFADVENKNVAKPEWQEHPYGMEEVKVGHSF